MGRNRCEGSIDDTSFFKAHSTISDCGRATAIDSGFEKVFVCRRRAVAAEGGGRLSAGEQYEQSQPPS